MVHILLASTSEIKLAGVQLAFNQYYATINTADTVSVPNPEQPVNSGAICCKNRLEYVMDNTGAYDFVIAVENGIVVTDDDKMLDICYVIVQTKDGRQFCANDVGIKFASNWYLDALNQTPPDYPLLHLGLSVTIGSMINRAYPHISKNNWMKEFGGKDRIVTIADQIAKCLMYDKLDQHLLKYPNFPKKGVLFQDLSKVMADWTLMETVIDLGCTLVKERFPTVTKIIGLDARGFIWGSILAYNLRCGFVMARKKGKLPGTSIVSVNYATEYSEDTIEALDEGLIGPDDNVVIADDLVATGGSLLGCAELVRKLGGKPIGCIVVLKVGGLFEGAQKRLGTLPIEVIVNN